MRTIISNRRVSFGDGCIQVIRGIVNEQVVSMKQSACIELVSNLVGLVECRTERLFLKASRQKTAPLAPSKTVAE
ncbi:hypothetical protein DFR28_103371 [Arenicella xantha]|uniref:Uncharacterized protein n=1 Tax=Arenicella xantha TaxID=644221 RepID=A0A395JJK1_9GAMM|nr:hypothetical protein DFR28_103371 [Arenicella xantha]